MEVGDSCKVVLVAGGTASGKTSIVQALVAQTGALHIAHDRYYIDASDPATHDFDHPDSLETALLVAHVGRLKAGDSVDLPRYGFPTHRRQRETDRVGPTDLVIVEGILVLESAELRALADLCVYVDAPDDVRLARRIQRDAVERGRSVQSVLERYEKMVRPSHERFVGPSAVFAQLVLDGTTPLRVSVARLVAALDGPDAPLVATELRRNTVSLPADVVLLGLVSQKTGYSAEELDLAFELGADLGIDSVKQAEIISEIQARFDFDRGPPIGLEEPMTLAAILRWIDAGGHAASGADVRTPAKGSSVDRSWAHYRLWVLIVFVLGLMALYLRP